MSSIYVMERALLAVRRLGMHTYGRGIWKGATTPLPRRAGALSATDPYIIGVALERPGARPLEYGQVRLERSGKLPRVRLSIRASGLPSEKKGGREPSTVSHS